MTSEEQVYVWTKQLFRAGDWTLLASDPPRGTDAPRLEIKEPGGVQSLTKNKNSIINDLIYCKNEALALIECKDSSSKISMDIEKLNTLLGEPNWRKSLTTAMYGRSLFAKEEAPSPSTIRDGRSLVPVLSYPGEPRPGLTQFVQITFDQGEENIQIGKKIPSTVRETLEDISS
jgi:hypothetical protein